MKQINGYEEAIILGYRYVNSSYTSEESEEVRAHYQTIAQVNAELFEAIPFEVVFTENDAYKDAKEMRKRVIKENKIYIYKGGNEHPFLSPEDNLKGRAVHDVFAHMVCGCPFSFQGELNAYYEQRNYYPREVWATLFAEIPMQTAGYYYSNGFDFPQRALEATERDMELVEHLKKDYSQHSVLDASELVMVAK